MRNNRGQALVEFIMVFPILLMILMAIIDFSNLFIYRFQLENKLNLISDLYMAGKNDKIDDNLDTGIDFNVSQANDYVELILTRKIKINTPGLNLIIGNPYTLKTSKFIYKEQETINE